MFFSVCGPNETKDEEKKDDFGELAIFVCAPRPLIELSSLRGDEHFLSEVFLLR
jgi:hypothetical protein